MDGRVRKLLVGVPADRHPCRVSHNVSGGPGEEAKGSGSPDGPLKAMRICVGVVRSTGIGGYSVTWAETATKAPKRERSDAKTGVFMALSRMA